MKGEREMNGLTIIKQNGGKYIDSRNVAEAIGKEHRHLLRDIRGYVKIIDNSNAPNFGRVDFFLENTYTDAKGETRPCYLVSKMGCEMIANKLTGEKGVLFTAAYVSRFNEMEVREKLEQVAQYHPRLGEFNAAARLIIPVLRDAGATPMNIIEFLRRVYEPLGIIVNTDGLKCAVRTWSATDIARGLGAFSVNGKPHFLAISAVVNMLGVDNSHKTLIPIQNGLYTGIYTRYDGVAAALVKDWFEKHRYPTEITFGNRVFKLRYSN
jgi:Rha family phage regulatory protein